MRELGSLTYVLTLLSILSTSLAHVSHHVKYSERDRHPHPHNPSNPHRQLLKRSITQDATTIDGTSFDFIIAGGGLAGLAVASRLSEWSNVTVLVIEAGGTGDLYEDQIDIPGYSYLKGLGGTAYDWNYTTVAQADNLNKTMSWPRGRGLGGSGAVNGLFYCIGGKEDYDAWETLNPNADQTWNWDEMSKHMMKAENYTAPTAAAIQEFGIPVEAANHGSGGPVQIGYSEYMFDGVKNWIPTWENLGLKGKDLFGGDTHGVTITPNTLNTHNQTRDDPKAAYIDPLPPRDNLVILTGQQVTQVLFNGSSDANGNKLASGVKFSSGKGQQTYSVQVNKDVILSGGSIGSPQILQLSGIGPKDKLASAGVDCLVDLPVGYNLQDHVSTTLYFATPPNTTTWGNLQNDQALQASQLQQYRADNTGMWTYVNEAIGYPAMSDLMDASEAADYASTVKAALSTDVSNVVSWQSLPSNVASGLTKQYTLQQQFMTSDVGQLEVILTMLGRYGVLNEIGIQCALQHPWSRGSIFIKSDDPFQQPNIDPDYFGMGYDIDIMNYGAQFIRSLVATAPMNKFAIKETAPGINVTGDALSNYIRNTSSTEYHPMGTCSMLPKEDGGVVDTNLVVYGTSNVRVMDSSIIPLHISAHLMASTYGIAEKGADIVKQFYMAKASTSSDTGSSQTTAKPGKATDTSVTKANDHKANGFAALSLGAKIGIGAGAGAALVAILAAILVFCCVRRKKKQQNAAASDYAKAWQGYSHNDAIYNKELAGDSSYEYDSHPLHSFTPSPQTPPRAYKNYTPSISSPMQGLAPSQYISPERNQRQFDFSQPQSGGMGGGGGGGYHSSDMFDDDRGMGVPWNDSPLGGQPVQRYTPVRL